MSRRVNMKELYEAGAQFNLTLNPKGTDFIDVELDGEGCTWRNNEANLHDYFDENGWDWDRVRILSL
jgi:hypothetical protein